MQTQMRWPETDPLDLAIHPEAARLEMHLAPELAKETEAVLRKSVEEVAGAAEAVEHVVVVDVESPVHDSFTS